MDSSDDAAVDFARGGQWLREPNAKDHLELSRGRDGRPTAWPAAGRHRRDGLLQRRILCASEAVQRMAPSHLQGRSDRPHQRRIASPVPRRFLQFFPVYRGQCGRGRFRRQRRELRESVRQRSCDPRGHRHQNQGGDVDGSRHNRPRDFRRARTTHGDDRYRSRSRGSLWTRARRRQRNDPGGHWRPGGWQSL